jgi:hypothetical protein
VDVGRVRGHAAELGDEHRQPWEALEEVLDREMERARPGVLLLDRLRDHRRVRRDRAAVVGDQQRAADGRDVLDPLDLDPEPVVVEELVDGAVEQALDAFGATPVGDLAVRLDRGQQRAHLVVGRRELFHAGSSSSGASFRRRAGQSGAHTMSSSAHSSVFQGCSRVATVIPASMARTRSAGLSSMRISIPVSSACVTLSSEQWSSS